MSEGLNFLAAVVASRSITALRNATEDHFVDDDEVAVFRYLYRHLERYSEIASNDAVFERTGIDLPETEDSVDYHWSRLAERKLYNDIREPYNELRAALGSRSMETVRDIVMSMSAAVMLNRERADLLPVGELGRSVLAAYDRAHNSPGMTGVPSGWPTIDEDTSGFQGGDLVTFVARPGRGKTYLLLNMTRHAYHAGFNVMFVTMEMSLDAIGRRYFAMEAGVDARQIRSGRLRTRGRERLRQVVEEYESANRLHFFGANMGQNASVLSAVIAERNPDIVFIDGVYLMRSQNAPRNTDRFGHVGYVFDDLKTLALARNIPIVVTTQFNREGARVRRRGRDSDALEKIAYSDAVSTNSSLVYSITFPPPQAVNQEALVISTEKGREGEGTRIAINFRFNPVNFEETSLDEVEGVEDVEPPDMDWMRNGH